MFLSFLINLHPKIENWLFGEDSSSFVSFIRKTSNFLQPQISSDIDSNLFRSQISFRCPKITFFSDRLPSSIFLFLSSWFALAANGAVIVTYCGFLCFLFSKSRNLFSSKLHLRCLKRFLVRLYSLSSNLSMVLVRCYVIKMFWCTRWKYFPIKNLLFYLWFERFFKSKSFLYSLIFLIIFNFLKLMKFSWKLELKKKLSLKFRSSLKHLTWWEPSKRQPHKIVKTYSNNSFVLVCLTILWGWHLKD